MGRRVREPEREILTQRGRLRCVQIQFFELLTDRELAASRRAVERPSWTISERRQFRISKLIAFDELKPATDGAHSVQCQKLCA